MSILTQTLMPTPTRSRPNNLSRRSLVGGLVSGLALTAVAPMPAFALSADGAKRLVEAIVADINRVIAAPTSEAQKMVISKDLLKE